MRSTIWAALALAGLGLVGCAGDNPPAGSISAQGVARDGGEGEAATSTETTVPKAPEAMQRGGRGID